MKEESDIRRKPKVYIIQMLTKKKWSVQILCAKTEHIQWGMVGYMDFTTSRLLVPSKITTCLNKRIDCLRNKCSETQFTGVNKTVDNFRTSLVAQTVKCLSTMQETRV